MQTVDVKAGVGRRLDQSKLRTAEFEKGKRLISDLPNVCFDACPYLGLHFKLPIRGYIALVSQKIPQTASEDKLF